MNRLAMIFAGTLLTAAPALAGGFVPEQMPPDVKWFIHVDVEGMRDSILGKMLLDGELEFGVQEVRSDVRTETGIDVASDVFDFLAYSTSEDPEEAVFIFTATRAIDTLIEQMAMDEQHYDTLEVNGHDFHAWHDDGDMYAYVRRDGARRLVVASSEAGRLARAIDVIDGRADNATSSPVPLLSHDPGMGTMVILKAFDVNQISDDNPVSQVLRRAEQVSLTLGEHNDRVQGELRVNTTNAEELKDIADVLNGMIALGRLVAHDKPELKPLSDLTRAIAISATSDELVVKLDCTPKQLKALEKLDDM